MERELKKKYVNITRDMINLYLHKCKTCQLKKNIAKNGPLAKPSIPKYMKSRCQVDVIDMQTEPVGPYKFILYYQDYLTKFLILRPLKSNMAHEVGNNLVDIFCLMGSPFILQSGNGREFSNSVITELSTLWPDLKIVHGRPRHAQGQGFVERDKQEIRDMLAIWVEENNTHWSEGLRFIQSRKNGSFHRGIGRSSYEAMFGTRQINGLGDADLPKDILVNLHSEEDLEEIMKSEENEDIPEYDIKMEENEDYQLYNIKIEENEDHQVNNINNDEMLEVTSSSIEQENQNFQVDNQILNIKTEEISEDTLF